MTTLEIKNDLRLKIKEKSATQLLSIYDNNQAKLESGSDLEEGMLINDVCIEEMQNRLRKINFFVGGLTDEQIYKNFKNKI